jgi:adenine phosphoribosyltransferase
MTEAPHASTDRLAAAVAAVPDFPRPGILFRDVTPILQQPQLFAEAVDRLAAQVEDLAPRLQKLVAIESRGFLFGVPLALRLRVGLAVARKPGKLPRPVVEQTYELEYGSDRLALHRDAVTPGEGVLVVDDLLATGGTSEATCRLVERLGGEILAALYFIELPALRGRERLGPRRVEAVLRF